ncbi:hypothetical protein D4R51_02305 [bacterium]|nr:MAG: hypothetical protein D4R51_02305 [bacterium]
MNVLEKKDHLLNTKLVLKSTDEFTDEQAEKVFLDTEMTSEADILEICGYLRQYRPGLLKKLEEQIKRKESAAKDRKPAEEKLVQEAIREVLKNQGRAHIMCADPQKDGIFTPIISIDGHPFKSVVFYKERTICLEMYERLLLDEQALKEFKRKIKRADMTFEPAEGEKRSVRLGISKKPEHLAVFALISINVEDGKEKIAEAFRAKLSGIVTTVTMLYFGMFDGPEGDGITEPTLTPAA